MEAIRSETIILLEIRETLLDMQDTLFSDKGLYEAGCKKYDLLCDELTVLKLSRKDKQN